MDPKRTHHSRLVLEVHLGGHSTAVQLNRGVRKVLHLRWDEEAGHEEGAAADAGELDVVGVEGDELGHHDLDEVVDGLGVGYAVGALEAGATAPEEVWVGGKECNAHGVGLDILVGEVEEGLAAIAVEEDVHAYSGLVSDFSNEKNTWNYVDVPIVPFAPLADAAPGTPLAAVN